LRKFYGVVVKNDANFLEDDMGWSIGLNENTIEFSEECAQELNAWAEKELGEPVAALDVDRNVWYIQFIDDWMEHMDFLWEKKAQTILCKHNARGRALFSSTEGDNAGEHWGHEFLPKGKKTVVKHLTGKVKWA